MSAQQHIDVAVAALRERGAVILDIAGAPWLADVEQRLGLSYPAAFRALVDRFSFEPLEIGGVELFANEGNGSDGDVTVEPFRDPHLSPWLMSHRLLQVGRPATGSYDPVCFDLTAGRSRDPCLVRLDHESILLDRAKVKRTVVAKNFMALLRGIQDG